MDVLTTSSPPPSQELLSSLRFEYAKLLLAIASERRQDRDTIVYVVPQNDSFGRSSALVPLQANAVVPNREEPARATPAALQTEQDMLCEAYARLLYASKYCGPGACPQVFGYLGRFIAFHVR